MPKNLKNEAPADVDSVSSSAAPAAAESAAAPAKKRTKSAKAPAAKKSAAKKKSASGSAKKTAPKRKPKQSEPAEPSDADIRLRAYFIAERRVQLALQGDPARDWLDAKQQLIEEARTQTS